MAGLQVCGNPGLEQNVTKGIREAASQIPQTQWPYLLGPAMTKGKDLDTAKTPGISPNNANDPQLMSLLGGPPSMLNRLTKVNQPHYPDRFPERTDGHRRAGPFWH
jgi:hypothetical protein